MTPAEELAQLLNGPAAKPPGDEMALDPNATGEGTTMAVVVSVIMMVITGGCAILRAYSRLVVTKTARIEDILGFIALGFYCGELWVVFRLAQMDVYLNHQWNFTFREFCDILYVLHIQSTMFSLCMMFVKPAILLEWNRIFASPTRNAFWWTCNVLSAINVIYYVVTLIMVQLYCTPHERIWNRYIPGTCRDRRSTEAPTTIFNLVLDILILLLPQKVIWKLQMTRSRKIGVSVIFSVGLLAVAAATGRVHAAWTMDYEYDVTYDVGLTSLWSLGEMSCAMLVFCIPALPKIVKDGTLLSKIVVSLRSLSVPLVGTSRGTSGGSAGSGSAGSRWRGTEIPNHSAPKAGKSGSYHSHVEAGDHSDVHLAALEMKRSRNGGSSRQPSEDETHVHRQV